MNLEQLRKQAKERVRAGLAPKLADAQLARKLRASGAVVIDHG